MATTKASSACWRCSTTLPNTAGRRQAVSGRITESRREAIEEQLFWPAVREESDDGDELADHAIAKEQAGRKLLARLEEGKPGPRAPQIRAARASAKGRGYPVRHTAGQRL